MAYQSCHAKRRRCRLLKEGGNERAMPRSEFDRLLPQNPAVENLMVEQAEWFSTRSGNLPGTITRGERVAR